MANLSRRGDLFKLSSDNHNYAFHVKTGVRARWGKTLEDDPDWGFPELVDMELTSICTHGCRWCYKSNTANGINMSLDTFKNIFHKLPKTVRQIAFGVDAYGTSNPDMLAIMDYCRNNDYNYVVPNVTVADITDGMADSLAKVCGAVAVSRYEDKNRCYDSVKRLTDRGLAQTNIHCLTSLDTAGWIMETFEDIQKDPRLSELNAIVLLSLKKKGRGAMFDKLSKEEYEFLINYAMDKKIQWGADSCSALRCMEAVKNRPDYEYLKMLIEPCESGLFSAYIDVHGDFYPCSFAAGTKDWTTGISVSGCDTFLKDIWHHARVEEWRSKLIATKEGNTCRNCPLFEI